jgi:hypothetical protein
VVSVYWLNVLSSGTARFLSGYLKILSFISDDVVDRLFLRVDTRKRTVCVETLTNDAISESALLQCVVENGVRFR